MCSEGAILQCNTALWIPFQAFYALTLYSVERKGCCDSKDHWQVICCGEFANCCRYPKVNYLAYSNWFLLGLVGACSDISIFWFTSVLAQTVQRCGDLALGDVV